MKKKLSLFIMSVFAVFASMMVVNAAETTVASGTVTSLDVTREVHNVSNPVKGTFSYEVLFDEGPANGFVASTKPADFTITFDGTETISADHKVSKSVTLNLSALKFTKLGDYKFIIKEKSATSPYPKDNEEMYFYVSVRNVLNPDQTPTGAFIAELAPKVKKNDTGDKVDCIFRSSLVTSHIKISNKVTGNFADVDKYFAYTVSILGETGDVYKINGAHSTDGSTEVTTSNYTVGTTTTIYLKHGQEVTIGLDGTKEQIPIEVDYTITETVDDGYSAKVDGADGNHVSKSIVETSDDTFDTDNVTAFTNHKEKANLTGMILNIVPFIMLFILGFVGIYYIRRTSEDV